MISVTIKPGAIIVEDNGNGIAASTIKSILDYSIRVSSREAYVSPTRGAQGNAVKSILPMGYVLDRECRDGPNAEAVGETVIETRGFKHRIQFRVDHVNNEPRITHTTAPSPLKKGTRVTVKWPAAFVYDNVTYLEYARDEMLALAEGYVWFNPHLSLRVKWHGKDVINVKASNLGWQKWRPRDPTSAHWYDEARFQRYMAAHVARDRDLGQHRTVREFIAEFRGLSGTAVQRKILAEVGCSHVSLREFFGIDQVNREGIAKLLASMKKHSKPVAAKHLGVIGEEHLKKRFKAAGGDLKTFKYQRRFGLTDEKIPYVVECAFGLHQSGLDSATTIRRKLVTGVNWSVGIHNPFRAFGRTGEGLESTLQKVRANTQQPVICALHLASAHVQYADRGKSAIITTDDVTQDDDD